MVKIWRTSKWNLLIRPIANQNESEHSILTKIILFVSANIHKTRQKTLIDCVKSLASGSSPSVNSIGRGIRSRAFEKHTIKRADRWLSDANLQHAAPHLYAAICLLFCRSKHALISLVWSELHGHKGQLMLLRPMSVKGRPGKGYYSR
jgi:hypothetical protein